ncbi:alpha/beta-hydrolase [Acephala macrosclerotiorum]|nr:alpha/beta-hydrolase [Acephala macrosclerotiorum]
MTILSTTLALLCCISTVVAFTVVSSQTPTETYASRTYFYAGDHYENVIIMPGQMYVEKLGPQRPALPYPPVFIPSSGQTSTNFFTAPQVAKLWPQASLHTQACPSSTPPSHLRFTPNPLTHLQWLGTGLKNDPIFDAFFAGEIQQQANDTIVETITVLASLALLDKIGPAILVTHSHSGPYGWGIADRWPSLVKATVAIEPEGPPFVQELVTETVASKGENLSSCVMQKELARKLVNLDVIPVLVVSSEASYHAVYDYCTVGYLRQAGVGVDWLDLPEGNAHFGFMELNNLEIVPHVEQWIRIHVG